MNLFLCETLANDVRYKQTAHPSEGSKNWKKTNTRGTYFPLKSIEKWKRQSGFAPKMIWKIDWFHREHKRTTNKESIQKKRKETLKNLPDWKKRKRKKLTRHSEKNKKKEGKRLLISNIYFYILIYQNKKSKENRTWTVKENIKKGPMRDGTFSVGSSQGRACNHAIVPHSTGRHQTHRLKDAAGIRQNKVSTTKYQTK